VYSVWRWFFATHMRHRYEGGILGYRMQEPKNPASSLRLTGRRDFWLLLNRQRPRPLATC
jgi:hypothetical protein